MFCRCEAISTFFSLLLCGFFENSFSHNLDTTKPITVHPGRKGYYFGYSLALHKHKKEQWLIVGAPLGNDTSRGYKPRYGAVYKCDLLKGSGQCDLMTNFDQPRVGRVQTSFDDDDYKTGQWMGGTVRSRENYIMACAPRFAWPGTSKKRKAYFPIGKCEIVDCDNLSNTRYLDPCVVPVDRQNDFGYCNFGVDADFNSNATQIAGGAPSLFVSNGRLVWYPEASWQNIKISLTSRAKFEEYTGYSVLFFRLTNGENEVVVAGAPSADYRRGLIKIYKYTKEIALVVDFKNPTKQIGSYFGSSLAVADVNGDGYKDLLVGAPYHCVSAEEGMAFVYINNNKGVLDLSPIFLQGDAGARARFGMSMVGAGDLDRDGYEDVAIGAPNGGPEGRGVVYIFKGSQNGLSNQWSQKIFPSQFGLMGLSLKAFGSSLSGGIDMDDNGHSDLAIGSFLSDTALFLRSKPVVSIKVRIILSHSQLNPNSTVQNCTGIDGKRRLCLNTTICVSTIESSDPVEIAYDFIVDEQQKEQRRGYFVMDSRPKHQISSSIVLKRSACVHHEVYMNKAPKNIHDPVVFKANFIYKPQADCDLCPIMRPTFAEALATYSKNCGSDVICTSDLKVMANVEIPNDKAEIHFGVIENFSFKIRVKNNGESAFLTKIIASIPRQLSVIGVRHLKDNYALLHWSFKRLNGSHNLLTFDAGNPIENSKEEYYDVRLAIKSFNSAMDFLWFKVNVTTVSKEINMEDNVVTVSAKVVMIADLTISGGVNPEQVTYNVSRPAKEVGPFILHTFLIQNKGPSPVDHSKVEIHYPEKIENSRILNLISITAEGSVNCHINESDYNPLGLTLDLFSEVDKSNGVNRRTRRSIRDKLDCVAGQCKIYTCDLGRLARGESVTISINSSLVEATFAQKLKRNTYLALRAVVVAESIKQPRFHFPDSSETILTVWSPKMSGSEEKTIPWWIVLISIIAGLVLVAGVVFVLYKSGFFNRKKKDYSFSSVLDEPND